MKLIVTSKQAIVAKDKKRYVLLKGIVESGDTVDIFTTEEQADGEFNLPAGAIATAEQIAKLFEDLPVCEVEFNQRGRLVSLKAF